MPGPLPNGPYEHLLTEALASALAPIPADRTTLEPLPDADAHLALARHLAREAARTLGLLPATDRAATATAILSALLDHLATIARAHHHDDAPILAQRLAPPPRRLLSIHRTTPTPAERPSTPLSESTLLTRNRAEPNLGRELAAEIASSDRIDAIVAFVTMPGVRVLRDALERFARRADQGAQLRLLTTVFTGTTEIAALEWLGRLPGVQLKISFDTRRTRLHAKAWLFHRATELTTAYVGSANLTATALGAGQEWMVKVCAADLPQVIAKFEGTFDTLWNDPEFEAWTPDDPDLRARLVSALQSESSPDAAPTRLVTIRPFPFQEEILDRLAAEREVHGRRRNLLVAATGTGKTVIAAFDYARIAARVGVLPRLLFLAHRREILDGARQQFRHVLQDGSFGELLTGRDEPRRFEHLFASIQSAGPLLDRLGPEHWRHVIVDECHHMPATSYQDVVPRLRADILVGLTATPERSDGKSLLPDFDGHVAAELRLWHALERQLLVPFEYYGIADDVDLRQVRWSRTGYDLGALSDVYTGHDVRAARILRQLADRVGDPRAVRALGFCVSRPHAEFMAACFQAAGVPAMAVHGGSPADQREEAPGWLRDRKVNVLFTCDLYNEGVDLPFVDTLLLLRPTMSATLFLQQLGRGLRHHAAKSTCLVLDFIGRHRDEFRFDAVLSAFTGVPRARLRRDLEEGFPFLPSGCSVQLDEVSRDVILHSLRTAVAGAQRLAAELRELQASREAPISLPRFLEESGRALDDVYTSRHGWAAIQRIAANAPADEEAEDLSRRFGRLLHADDLSRWRTYEDALAAARAGRAPALDARARLRLQMLDFQLQERGVLSAAEDTIRYLAARPAAQQELKELHEVLAERVTLVGEYYPVPEWPLLLHRHYRRREILAAVGEVRPGDKKNTVQGGILKLYASRRELLFVTLDKSSGSFSPSTRYRDYALSRDRFHWETQGAASVDRPSGRRYLDSATNGWSFYLFVRTDPEAAYAFLGRAIYETHAGDRPIAITWKLDHAMPAGLFERYATLTPG
ncbi:MAG TPA: DUF3427 domain-containing protein [Myxococcota bacterium]|nr:DUF3427 domain-containing protein [Myxococcota bacterium]